VFREVVSRVEPQVLEADAEAEVSLLLLFVPSQYWFPPWGSGDDVAFKEDVAFEKGVRILDAEVD
jgi:hypothetical protein